MRALLGSLRRLLLGETWTIPAGVGIALAVARLMRDSVAEGAWDRGGGFALAALVIAALAASLRSPR
jgi:hypothetical protein